MRAGIGIVLVAGAALGVPALQQGNSGVAAHPGGAEVRTQETPSRTLEGPPRAQEPFRWSGELAAGRTIRVHGLNGDIEAVRADGRQAEVTAVKTLREGHRENQVAPADVRIRVVEGADGVTICALYPGMGDECPPTRGGERNVRTGTVTVDFTVRVPAGVRFEAQNVNGGISVERLASDLSVSTVNGGVDVSTSGLAEASTVNGSIRAALGSGAWTGGLDSAR